MQVEALNNAIAAAERFLETAKEVEIESFGSGRKFVKVPSPKNSACKRASLDLTRALSELRRP
jgi:hypothetical protein